MNSTEQFYPLNFTDNTSWTFYIYFYTNVLYIVSSLPANCYIVWLMVTGKGTAYVSDFFTFNLAAGEIFYSCACMISHVIDSFSRESQFSTFIGVMPVFGRPLFLCLICVERYVAVVYPIIFLKCKPLRYRLACSAVVWVIVAGFGLFCMFIFSSKNLYISICVFLPQYSFFLTVKLFCCLSVVRALKEPGPGERCRQREEASLMKRRAITHILILTAAMVISYAPVYVMGIFYGILHNNDLLLLVSCGVSISTITGLVQPFLYIKQFGNLTKLYQMFQHLCNCRQ